MDERIPSELQVRENGGWRRVDIYSDEGFDVLADLYRRSAWQHRVWDRVEWLGVPVRQTAEDLVMQQALLAEVRPRLVIETGVWRGGSVIFHASVLEMLGDGGRVIGVDIHVPPEVRDVIDAHPMGQRVEVLESDSTDEDVLRTLRREAHDVDPVLVILDSGHTAEHVSAELDGYADLVTPGSYLVAMDGVMADLYDAPRGDPSWRYDNPDAAVRRFLAQRPEFEVDPSWERLRNTYAPGAHLRRRHV